MNFGLTPREKQLLRRLAARKTDAEIAYQLGTTVKRIVEQRNRLLGKLKIQSEADIAEAALQLAPWPKHKGAT
jgi:DNA-binding CsgD family transcriptional regulator